MLYTIDKRIAGPESWTRGRLMKAFDCPLVVVVRDPKTGLDRHLIIRMDPSLMDVKKLGEAPARSDAALMEHPVEPERVGQAVSGM